MDPKTPSNFPDQGRTSPDDDEAQQADVPPAPEGDTGDDDDDDDDDVEAGSGPENP